MKFLLDEMLPPSCADALRKLGHASVTVVELGMAAAGDADVFAAALAHECVLVTENFADFAGLVTAALNDSRPCAPVVFVHRDRLPRRGALETHLAQRLSDWAANHPDPFSGVHWL